VAKSRAKESLSTETIAAAMLLKKDPSIRKIAGDEKLNLCKAFLKKEKIELTIGKVKDLKAFDFVRCRKTKKPKRQVKIDFSSVEDIEKNLENITLIEMKSSDRIDIDKDFGKYFMPLGVREFLLAVALKDRYRFILVHVGRGTIIELRWQDILARAKTINLDFKITLE
jgi:hypothetical protein